MVRELDDQQLDSVLSAAGSRPRDDLADQRAYSNAWDRLDDAMVEDPAADERHGTSDVARRRLHLLADRTATSARRRRVSRLATATLAVVVIGGGTAAAAEFLASRTGTEHTGWEVNAAGSGEIIDKGGDDLRQTVEELTADIPFAPGYDQQHENTITQFGTADPGSTTTVSLLRFEVGRAAVCTWADAWVDADNRDDTTAQTAAAGTLQSAVSWEALTAYSDALLQPRPAESAGVDDGTLLWWVQPLAQAAATGQRQQVLGMAAASYACGSDRSPVMNADPDFAWPGGR